MLRTFNRTNLAWLIGLLAAAILISMGYYENLFRAAPLDVFPTYLHESESLVLGKIIGDREHLSIDHHSNLGFAVIRDYAYDGDHVAQAYGLISRKAPLARTVRLVDITDSNWEKGISRREAGVTVSASEGDLQPYLGRPVVLPDGGKRIIRLIHSDGVYTNLYLDGAPINPAAFGGVFTLQLTGEPVAAKDILVYPYTSQFGVQGIVYSWLSNGLHLDLKRLYRVQAFLLGLTMLALSVLFARIFGVEFGVIFLITVAFSPWLTLFGRNLYWATYLWFLPAVAVAMHYLEESKRRRTALLVIFYLFVLAKCLAGYEYISTVIWFAGAVYLIAPFLPNRRYTARQAWLQFAIFCAIGVAAFATALLVHAPMRGTTLLDGLHAIYVDDVKRRTYGSEGERFGPAIEASLSASPLSVVSTYIFGWTSNLLPGIKGRIWFPVLLGAALATGLYKTAKGWPTGRRDLAMVLVFVAAPLSWFVLAKGHSFIHTHLNYVLWYFGAVAAILYVAWNGFRVLVLSFARWSRVAQPEHY